MKKMIPNNLLRLFLFMFLFLFATSHFSFKNNYEIIYDDDDDNCSVYNISLCNFCSPGTIYNDSKTIKLLAFI